MRTRFLQYSVRLRCCRMEWVKKQGLHFSCNRLVTFWHFVNGTESLLNYLHLNLIPAKWSVSSDKNTSSSKPFCCSSLSIQKHICNCNLQWVSEWICVIQHRKLKVKEMFKRNVWRKPCRLLYLLIINFTEINLIQIMRYLGGICEFIIEIWSL